MAILFVGGEPGDFDTFGTVSSDTSATTRFDTNFARSYIIIPPVTFSYINAPLSQSYRELYIKYRYSPDSTLPYGGAGNSASERYILSGWSNASRVFSLNGTNQLNRIGLEVIANNSVLASVPEFSFSWVRRIQYSIDCTVRLTSSGEITIRLNGAVLVSLTGDFSSCSPCNMISFGPGSPNTPNIFSEITIADEDIRQSRLKTIPLSANGAVQQWSGDVSSVNAFNTTDANNISSDAVGETCTYLADNMDNTGSLPVRAVVVKSRSSRGSSGPQNLSGIVRIGGVNYDVPSTQPDTLLGPSQAIFNLNPATSDVWTRNDIDNAEFGLRSET